jgi:hypothetical protein
LFRERTERRCAGPACTRKRGWGLWASTRGPRGTLHTRRTPTKPTSLARRKLLCVVCACVRWSRACRVCVVRVSCRVCTFDAAHAAALALVQAARATLEPPLLRVRGAWPTQPTACRVVSCRVVLRVVSCRAVSCVSCRVVSCRVVSCRVVSCRVVSCRVVSDRGLWSAEPGGRRVPVAEKVHTCRLSASATVEGFICGEPWDGGDRTLGCPPGGWARGAKRGRRRAKRATYAAHLRRGPSGLTRRAEGSVATVAIVCACGQYIRAAFEQQIPCAVVCACCVCVCVLCVLRACVVSTSRSCLLPATRGGARNGTLRAKPEKRQKN